MYKDREKDKEVCGCASYSQAPGDVLCSLPAYCFRQKTPETGTSDRSLCYTTAPLSLTFAMTI